MLAAIIIRKTIRSSLVESPELSIRLQLFVDAVQNSQILFELQSMQKMNQLEGPLARGGNRRASIRFEAAVVQISISFA